MILLYHETITRGNIATSESKVVGEHHEARHYSHNGNFVEIDGDEHVVAHDAEDICKIPGYRLATPKETETYLANRRSAGKVHETTFMSKDKEAGDVVDEKTKGGK